MAMAAQDIPSVLQGIGLHGCKRWNRPRVKHKDRYKVLFYVHLVRFLKKWSWHEMFAVPYGNLNAVGVDFKAAISDYIIEGNPPINIQDIVNLENKAQEVIDFAAQLSPSTWQNKDVAFNVRKQAKLLQKIVALEVRATEEHPEKHLVKLLNLNLKLTALYKNIFKAMMGNQSALEIISRLGDPNFDRTSPITLANEEEKKEFGPVPFIPNLAITEVLRTLTVENEKLLEDREKLRNEIKALEKKIRSKGRAVPKFAYKRPILKFAFGVVDLTIFLKDSPAKAKARATVFYENCIFMSDTMLYEDDVLKIVMTRSLGLTEKIRSVKLVFFNRLNNTELVVHRFFFSQNDKNGNPLVYCVAVTVSSDVKFPLSIKPRSDVKGDFKFTLHKFFIQEIKCRFEYQ